MTAEQRARLLKWAAVRREFPDWQPGPDWRCPHGRHSCEVCDAAGIDYHDPAPAIAFLKSLAALRPEAP